MTMQTIPLQPLNFGDQVASITLNSPEKEFPQLIFYHN